MEIKRFKQLLGKFQNTQPANHKPVEFGTSFNKAKPIAAAPNDSQTVTLGNCGSSSTLESKLNNNRFDQNRNHDPKPTDLQNDKPKYYASQQKTDRVGEKSIHVGRPLSIDNKSVTKPITPTTISKQEPEWKNTTINNNNKQSVTNNNTNNNVSLKRTPSQLISAAVDKKMLESKANKAKITDQKDDVQVKPSGLRATSDNYKKENPVHRPHHPTAPAGTGLSRGSASFSFGSNVSTRATDRLKYFREAAEKEKARKEKLKLKEEDEKATQTASASPASASPASASPRERLSSAPASVPEPAKDNRTAPCMKKREQKRPIRRTMSISSIVLDWCKEMVRDYGIQVKNFSSSWNDGMAFCALIHRFHPDAFNFDELSPVNREHNFKTAFETAYKLKNVPMLLDVEDMVNLPNPEPRSVQCYIQWIWSVYGPVSGYGPSQEDIKKAQVA